MPPSHGPILQSQLVLTASLLSSRRIPHPEVPFVLSSVAQSCPTLCDPMDCSPPVSSVHGILQARILEWVVIPLSRGSSLLQGW